MAGSIRGRMSTTVRSSEERSIAPSSTNETTWTTRHVSAWIQVRHARGPLRRAALFAVDSAALVTTVFRLALGAAFPLTSPTVGAARAIRSTRPVFLAIPHPALVDVRISTYNGFLLFGRQDGNQLLLLILS
jgi:hypothetical protein